jgi:hypothetical protein
LRKKAKVIPLPTDDSWKSLTFGELHEYIKTDPRARVEFYSYETKDGRVVQEGVVHFKDLHKSGPFEVVAAAVRAMLIPQRRRKSA